MSRTSPVAMLIVLSVSPIFCARMAAQAPENVIHSFGSISHDGVDPEAALTMDGAGNLYGTTVSGGVENFGIVFELTKNPGGGWTETLLHSFVSESNIKDGRNPWGKMILDAAGNLYGTTQRGGTDGLGTVFELSPPVPPSTRWTETVLYSFLNNGVDGQSPIAGLLFDPMGNLYGATYQGGPYGCGTVFELSRNGVGWTETVLHTFTTDATDGKDPRGGLVFDAEGNLYGTTLYGGANGTGTAFKLSPIGGGWSETLLHSFSNNSSDGGLPSGAMIFDAAGNLYGTTIAGGPSQGGTVFELVASSGSGGWTEKMLYNFDRKNNQDGFAPYGDLIFDTEGNLYGTTLLGGTGISGGLGTVYELKKQGGIWAEKILHNFVFNEKDGNSPASGLVQDSKGNLYGAASAGGAYGGKGVFNDGIVFEIAH